MRKILPALAVIGLVATAAPQAAEAKGCVRGAIAGGVAGHYMGHHAVLGAVGGCLAARAYYKHQATQQKAAAAAQKH